MKTEHIEINKNHIWGRYHELRINPTCIQRTVYIEEGGENSLHRHATEEWMTVIAGEIQFTLGETTDNLSVKTLGVGDAIYIPANYWHRITYVSGEFMVDNVKCAMLNETMLGEHFDGDYVIERHDPASPSVRHKK
jgi:quercetin dioxygenase-like cupin family protein